MPNSYSVPGCKSNCNPDGHVPVFKMPLSPPTLNDFQKEDIDYTFKVPKGDGTFTEVPRAKSKLKEGAIPSLLPGCPAYYLTKLSKRTRLSYDAKEDDLMNQTLRLSLRSKSEEKEKFVVNSLQDLKDKLTLISLPNSWLV